MLDVVKYYCPVCNFKGLHEPAYNSYGNGSYDICPCCGFEFGLDNFDYSSDEEAHDKWRDKWIKDGYKFFSESEIPDNWDPKRQLEGLNDNFNERMGFDKSILRRE